MITCAGDKGFIFADYVEKEVVISNNHAIREIKCPASHDFKVILDNLVKAINKKEKIIATAEDGINSLKTALSAYKAVTTKKPAKI